MELKELILETLEELDEKIAEDGLRAQELLKAREEEIEAAILSRIEEESSADDALEAPVEDMSEEVAFLEHSRERLLVLFEGLQAEETKNIEAKLDITLNFLEYYLASVEDRLQEKK